MMTRKVTKFWDVDKSDATTGNLYLYGIIASETWWGDEVSPKQLRDDIAELGEVDVLNVHIFSDGGDVFAGNAIYSILRQQSAEVNVYIEGICASIATVIAMAGDNIYISSTGMMLLHNPMFCLWGMFNADDFRDMIADLDKLREPLIATYVNRTGASRDEVVGWLNGEKQQGTWFTADEAIEAGLSDSYIPEEIEVELEAVAFIGNGKYRWGGQVYDLSAYSEAPKVQKSTRKERSMKLRKTKNSAEPEVQAAAEDATETVDEVISITCPDCGAVFDYDTGADEVVEGDADGDEGAEDSAADSGGEGEASSAEDAYADGVRAERERIAALDVMLAANPSAVSIISDVKAQGWSVEKAAMAIVAGGLTARNDDAAKGTAFLNTRSKDLEANNRVEADPTNNNADSDKRIAMLVNAAPKS